MVGLPTLRLSNTRAATNVLFLPSPSFKRIFMMSCVAQRVPKCLRHDGTVLATLESMAQKKKKTKAAGLTRADFPDLTRDILRRTRQEVNEQQTGFCSAAWGVCLRTAPNYYAGDAMWHKVKQQLKKLYKAAGLGSWRLCPVCQGLRMPCFCAIDPHSVQDSLDLEKNRRLFVKNRISALCRMEKFLLSLPKGISRPVSKNRASKKTRSRNFTSTSAPT